MSVKGGELSAEEQTAAVEEARAEAERLEWGHPESPPVPADPLITAGARVFESQCAQCHKVGGETVPLALTTTMNAPDAANLIRVTFGGIQPPAGVLDRSMPARALQISEIGRASCRERGCQYG